MEKNSSCIWTWPGERGQLFECCFIVDEWSGELVRETDESTDAQFFSVDGLPEASSEFWRKHQREVLRDLAQFHGSGL